MCTTPISLLIRKQKSLDANDKKQEFEFVDHSPSNPPVADERPQPLSTDETQLHRFATNLEEQSGQRVEENYRVKRQQKPEPDAVQGTETDAASPEPRKSRRNSFTRWLLDSLGPLEPYEYGTHTFIPDDVYVEFNGLLYNAEFGSPKRSMSRIYGEAEQRRYRPQNPASKAKNSRYSWGGFDLAHRTGEVERQDDLVAILEHDESNTHGHVTAPADEPVTIPRRELSERRSGHQDDHRSGIVIETSLQETIAADPTGQMYSTLNNHDDNQPDSGNIQAFMPRDAASAPAPEPKTPTQRKRRSFIRRMSLSLFNKRRNSNVVNGNAIKV
ncbi:hypothetical protein UA08_07097 [Talaromyces atroroseus]|uniref:Uncharacterized protein n=1 Tax=Talaromyces atroroseus TaxID=1441469 RepID=A0A225ASY3_TALAT|nr:hypothetical protein UA08_07097 [Talaromyces atroroseus]OKL57525.1 hypothetical protein UA08_07097 [Talaromyces atroroseus]